VSVQLLSEPPGALVQLGDRSLGTTPVATALDASDAPVTLTFSRDGYLAQTVSVVPTEGVVVPTVRLRRRRQGGQDPSGVGLPIKTGL
jgi:hypothetical protein